MGSGVRPLTTIDAQRCVTVVDLDLSSERLPVHQLAPAVPNVSFLREGDLQASADGAQWRTILLSAAICAYDPRSLWVADCRCVSRRYFELTALIRYSVRDNCYLGGSLTTESQNSSTVRMTVMNRSRLTGFVM